MSLIKKDKLPLGVKLYVDFIIKSGGKFSIKEESIISSDMNNGIITDCHLVEDNIELKWFTTEDILYIFIDGVNICYCENEKLVFI